MNKPKFFHKKSFWIIFAVILIVAIGFAINFSSGKGKAVACNLSTTVKGDLSRTYSITGRVSSSNTADITTTATGVIKEVYAKDGDEVKSGQKIALIELDQQSQQIQAKSYAAYLSAQVAYEAALNGKTSRDIDNDSFQKSLTESEQSKASLQSSVDTAKKAVVNAENELRIVKDGIYKGSSNPLTFRKYSVYDLKAAELTLKAAKESLTDAEQNLANADTNIDLARKQLSLSQDKQRSYSVSLDEASANLRAARIAYDLSGSVIKAPISGKIKGVKVVPGTIIQGLTGTAGFKIANVETTGKPLISADATESEAPFIQIGQKAIVKFDVISNKQFEGRVVAINNKTTANDNYEVTLELNSEVNNLLPNMSADIDIMPEAKQGILLIPNTAIEESGGKNMVKKFANGVTTEVKIEVGDESDTQTEVRDGLNEGDQVLTNFLDKNKPSQSCQDSLN